MGNIKNIIEVKNSLEDAQTSLPKSLNDHLENLEITKEELEKFEQEIKDDPETLEKALKTYSIRKKLHTVLNEKALHDNIKEAVDFLNEIIALNKK